MAAAAFLIGGILGILTAATAGTVLGYGFLACFGIYIAISVLAALAVLLSGFEGSEEGRFAPSFGSGKASFKRARIEARAHRAYARTLPQFQLRASEG